MRTIFVEAPGVLEDGAIAEVTVVLNERLGGLRLGEIRTSSAERLRDGVPGGRPAARELLNIFVQEADTVFDVPIAPDDDGVVLGQASVLAEILRQRSSKPGISITIGNEHADPRLGNLTIVTAEYRAGSLTGVIGVIGPTRMPYEKVISLVGHTSRLVTDLLG